MITKIGRYVLKENTKKMDQLNREMRELAIEMSEMDVVHVKESRQFDSNLYDSLLVRAVQNREQHTELQEEINKVINLEWWLKLK